MSRSKFTPGERCLLRVIDGQPCAIHYQCDDYPDGTISSIETGEVIS